MEERETGRCDSILLSTSFQNSSFAFQTALLRQLHLGLKSFTMQKPLLQKTKIMTDSATFLPASGDEASAFLLTISTLC